MYFIIVFAKDSSGKCKRVYPILKNKSKSFFYQLCVTAVYAITQLLSYAITQLHNYLVSKRTNYIFNFSPVILHYIDLHAIVNIEAAL